MHASLAAESKNFPIETQLEVQKFYELNFSWLAKQFQRLGYEADPAREKVCQLLRYYKAV